MAMIDNRDETFCAWPRVRTVDRPQSDGVMPSGWWLLPAIVMGVVLWTQIILSLFG